MKHTLVMKSIICFFSILFLPVYLLFSRSVAEDIDYQSVNASIQWSDIESFEAQKSDHNLIYETNNFRDNAELLCTESFVFSNYLNVKYVAGMSYSNVLSACGSLYSFYYYLNGLGYDTPTSKNGLYNYLDIYFLNCSSTSLGYPDSFGGLTFKDSAIDNYSKTHYSTIYILNFSSPTSEKLNTIYHEFFHAIQNMYYSTTEYVFKEAIAECVGGLYSEYYYQDPLVFQTFYLGEYYRLDYYSNHDYLYSYIFDIIYDMLNNDLDTMFSFLLDYYETLNSRTSTTITLSETVSVLDSVISTYNSLFGFEKIWFNMVVRYLGCDVSYYNYFYPTTNPNFNDYFTTVTYYGSGYMSASVSFADWGFHMYNFPTIPSSPYYGRVKFQMSANHSFAIVVYDPNYSYQSVIYSNSSNYFQFTYDINTYRLNNVRFAVVNLEKATLNTSLYIYQLV